MKKINWGIIGLGEVAQKFSEGFSKISNAKLLAISSRNLKKLDVFSKKFFIEEKFSFQNYEDLISCEDRVKSLDPLKTVSNISRIFSLMSESETEESIRKSNNQRLLCQSQE